MKHTVYGYCYDGEDTGFCIFPSHEKRQADLAETIYSYCIDVNHEEAKEIVKLYDEGNYDEVIELWDLWKDGYDFTGFCCYTQDQDLVFPDNKCGCRERKENCEDGI